MARLVKERQERELKRANSLKETREQEAIMVHFNLLSNHILGDK